MASDKDDNSNALLRSDKLGISVFGLLLFSVVMIVVSINISEGLSGNVENVGRWTVERNGTDFVEVFDTATGQYCVISFDQTTNTVCRSPNSF